MPVARTLATSVVSDSTYRYCYSIDPTYVNTLAFTAGEAAKLFK
jgi:hypothetical protein